MPSRERVQPSLLVSVRTVQEAEAALAGGADLIDVKEPAHGSLGRASEAALTAVLRTVAGRRPVSAALGELAAGAAVPLPCPPDGLAYAKWGLSGYAERTDACWRNLAGAAEQLRLRLPDCRPVAVAYADWRRAGSPPPVEVFRFSQDLQAGAFLLDTWQKDGTTLLDWFSVGEVSELCQRCRAAGVPVALAGSLGASEIRRLLSVRPDWFAVRGAVCEGNQRTGRLCAQRVRALVDLIRDAVTAAPRAG